MPTGRETVVNRALSGDELKKIILADAQRLVDNEGLLSPHIAFGRIGYTLTLRLHVDNPVVPGMPYPNISMASRPMAQDLIAATPELAAVESAPLLNPSPESEVGSMELTREIISPNAERLREGMPVPVLVKGQDGTTTTEQIAYPSDPELGPGEIMLKDATEMARQQWGLVEPSQTEAKVE
jgi:hypothetical protein